MTKITKTEFRETIRKWLEQFLDKKYSETHKVKVLVPNRALSKLNDETIKKKVKNISFFDFKPHILGILERREDQSIDLVLVNREIKSIGLREIGEMLCYCRVAKPLLALIFSIQGLASQIDRLINHNKRHDIIIYDNRKLKILRWDLPSNDIDKLGITPLEEREFFE